MRTDINLTIRDYFNQSAGPGLRSGSLPRGPAPSGGDKASFMNAMTAAQAAHSGKQQGMSIQDYLQRRIRSHSGTLIRGLAVGSTPCKPLFGSGPQTQTDQEEPAETVAPHVAALSLQNPPESAAAGDRHKILTCIEKAAARYGLPAALIEAVVKAESAYQVRAVSPAGAQGLMQLMPATARELGVTDPFDIDQNILGGAQYLRDMLDQFNGDVHLALTAYNAGPGTVARYSGNVPYKETHDYVQRVLRYAAELSAPAVT